MCNRNIDWLPLAHPQSRTWKNINWLPLAYPQPGTWPATLAFSLTGNRTSDLLVYRMMPSPLSYTSQGANHFLKQWKSPWLVWLSGLSASL